MSATDTISLRLRRLPRNPDSRTVRCVPCGYQWVPLNIAKPCKQCPKCHACNWDKPPGSHIKPMEQRFWEKVNKNGPIPAHCPELGPCWVWTGSLASHCHYGYIAMSRTREPIRAHRFSYQLHFGGFPNELNVLHKCDNPPCVNPNHLFLGTQADNAADMRRKNRANDPRGSRTGGAKLTEAQVLSIVKLLPAYTFVEVAAKYNVSPMAIIGIAKGRTWSHITGIDPTMPYRPHYRKLSPEDVLEIVQTYTLKTGPVLAERFSVRLATIRNIMYGNLWSNLTGIKPRSRYRLRRTRSGKSNF